MPSSTPARGLSWLLLGRATVCPEAGFPGASTSERAKSAPIFSSRVCLGTWGTQCPLLPPALSCPAPGLLASRSPLSLGELRRGFALGPTSGSRRLLPQGCTPATHRTPPPGHCPPQLTCHTHRPSRLAERQEKREGREDCLFQPNLHPSLW